VAEFLFFGGSRFGIEARALREHANLREPPKYRVAPARQDGPQASASRGRVPPLYPLTRAHEVDSATRWGRHLAAVADSIFAKFGSGPRRSLRRSAESTRSGRVGGAAAAGRRRHRGDDGARALVANAADAAAPASYGVIAKVRY